jgi:hypothetical protein
MPFSLYNHHRLTAYLYHQAVQPSGSTAKTQIWIAISVYVLVAILKKQMQIQLSLYTILQILSLTCFEKVSLLQLLTKDAYKNQISSGPMQLKLFNS